RGQRIRGIYGSGKLRDKTVRERSGCSATAGRHNATCGAATLNYDIGTNDSDFKRQTGTSVCNRSNFPVAENRVADSAEVVFCSSAERQIVNRAQVESMAHIEIVVALVVIEIAE